MGRKVFISSDMSTDDRLIAVAEKDPETALLWPWFLTAFDDWGRAAADPRPLKARVFPAITSVTAEDVERALGAFAAVGMIVLYEADGKKCMAIPEDKWFRYQTQIPKSKRQRDESRIAAPRAAYATLAQTRGIPRDSAQTRDPTAATLAQTRGIPRILSPSPSPSPPDLGTNVPMSSGCRILPQGSDDPAPSPDLCSADAPAAVMACWNDRWVPEPWARPLALTPKRRQHITARLRRFSVEELCEAIRVMRLSPHHCGRNDRHWIAPPEFLLRSDEQVERFLAMPTGDAAPARGETPGYRRLDSDEARREVGLL